MKALLAVLLFSLSAFAQNKPPACSASVTVPPTLRAEGLTELTGDMLLTCQGGSPIPTGTAIPPVHITVFVNTTITSRLSAGLANEALLIIDEPSTGPTGSSSWTPQGCPPPGPCSIVGNGTGVNLYNGTPGHPNIFQGIGGNPSSNAVTFLNVPLDAPGTNNRTIRITNIRANANALALTSPGTGAGFQAYLIASLNFSGLGSGYDGINIPNINVATVQSGVQTAVKGSSNQFCSSLGLNGNTDAPSNGQTKVIFTEGFPGSFKQQQSSPPATGPNTGTESGTILPASAGLNPLIGTANSGTNLGVTITGLQPGLIYSTPLNPSLTDSITGNVIGSTTASSPNGTIGPTSLQVTGNSNGTAQITFTVNGRTIGTNPAQLNTIFTLGGNPLSLSTPANIYMYPGFVNPPTVPEPFALAQSTQTAVFPFFSTLNSFATPIAVPTLTTNPINYLGATIVGCVDGGNSLNLVNGQKMPAFTGAWAPPTVTGTTPGTNGIWPQTISLPIVSSGLPTTGVTYSVSPAAPWLNVTVSDTTTPFTAFLSANPPSGGNYSTTLQFNSPGGINLSVPVTATVTQAPWFTIYGFANSASYVSTVVAPGMPFVLFGQDAFGPSAIAGPTLGTNGLVPTTLGLTQVMFDGTPASLYYSLNNNGIGQVAGFAPFELAGKSTTSVQVVYNGVTSPPVQLAVTDALPGLYTANSDGGGQGAILNHDLTVNSDSNPESIGNLVVFYGGGGGQTSPPGRDGALAGVGGPLATFAGPVQAFIDGISATVQYAGPAPGLVEGVFQINVIIPNGVRHNADVPVAVVFNGKQSQSGVTLAVK